MSLFKRRKRRPDGGRYLPKDAAAWAQLVSLAKKAVSEPWRHGVKAARAADRCARCVPPPGFATRDSVFLQLVVKARVAFPGWNNRTDAEAAELVRLADACAAVLEAPKVRARKDLED